MRGGRGRGPRQSTAPRAVPSPSPFHPNRRDSDGSMCSSRPSSAGGRPSQSSALLSDRASQSSALRSVNSYLTSLSSPISLRPPLPSARDITDCLLFLLSRLDLSPAGPHPHHQQQQQTTLDPDDLISVLKLLNCPVKINRSALRAPGTPHSWPPLLSVIYWLVQLAKYTDHQLSSSPPPRAPNDLFTYTSQSYSLYISGDDDAVTELDNEYVTQMERGAANAAESVEMLAKEAAELEDKVTRLKSGVSRKEELERERNLLVEDNKKFESVVESFKEQVGAMEAKLRDWEKELEAKQRENRRICEENEELERRIEGQAVNARDVERMRRELQVVERDVREAENGRNAMEEKAWELEADISKRLKELEVMVEQCNQAMRK